jgi:hypothetical protein
MYTLGEITTDLTTSPAEEWPTTEKYVTSNFGYRYLNGTYDDDHYGIDIRTGTQSKPVYAAGDGTVLSVDNNNCGGEGRSIVIDHGNGWTTRYYHLASISVSEGDSVDAGDQIALSGASANCSNTGTDWHLHFELRHNNIPYDPAAFYTSYSKYEALYSGNNGLPYIPTQRRGDSGTYVSLIQDALRYHGYSLTVDGVFGSQTESVVKQFQKDQGITDDGIVGPRTWKELMGDIN